MRKHPKDRRGPLDHWRKTGALKGASLDRANRVLTRWEWNWGLNDRNPISQPF